MTTKYQKTDSIVVNVDEMINHLPKPYQIEYKVAILYLEGLLKLNYFDWLSSSDKQDAKIKFGMSLLDYYENETDLGRLDFFISESFDFYNLNGGICCEKGNCVYYVVNVEFKTENFKNKFSEEELKKFVSEHQKYNYRISDECVLFTVSSTNMASVENIYKDLVSSVKEFIDKKINLEEGK